MSRSKCGDEVFVVAWQKADTIKEAAEVTGYTTDERGTNACRTRARYLRKLGVPLKKINGKPLQKLKFLARRAMG